MPTIVSIYLALYLLLIAANSIYCLYGKAKIKVWMLVYEILSGAFIIFMAAAYWIPMLKPWPGIGCAVAFLIVLLLDMRFTIAGTPQELGIEELEMGDLEVDMIKGLSLVFAAPAYIMGMLLSVELTTR